MFLDWSIAIAQPCCVTTVLHIECTNGGLLTQGVGTESIDHSNSQR
jgi:hypothetical protein